MAKKYKKIDGSTLEVTNVTIYQKSKKDLLYQKTRLQDDANRTQEDILKIDEQLAVLD